MSEDFGYSRAQAIADGVLVDVTEHARGAGFRYPTAVTANVWARCIAVPLGVPQTEIQRLWHVLNLGAIRVRAARGSDEENADRLTYTVAIVTGIRDGRQIREYQPLIIQVGPGDDQAPVVTIMFPEDD